MSHAKTNGVWCNILNIVEQWKVEGKIISEKLHNFLAFSSHKHDIKKSWDLHAVLNSNFSMTEI